MGNGNFYLDRLMVLNISKENIIKAIKNPTIIPRNNSMWTITNTNENEKYVSGRLSRFVSQGEIPVVDTSKYIEKLQAEENLLIASSQFVYIPSESAIAYLHVWNKIHSTTFQRRMEELICEKSDNIFCKCEIEHITLYSDFLGTLNKFESVTKISARVIPPNPLYNDLWKRLTQYLRKRNVNELKMEEKGNEDGINTEINRRDFNDYNEEILSPIDMAMLLSLDGYGEVKISGILNGKNIIINSQENPLIIKMPKNTEAELLYKNAIDLLNRMNEEKGSKHEY